MSDSQRSTVPSPSPSKHRRIGSRFANAFETCALVLGMLLVHGSRLAAFLRCRIPGTSAHLAGRFASRLARRPLALFTVLLLPVLVADALLGGAATNDVSGEIPFEGSATTSRYVHWMTDDVAADRAFSYRLGCRAGERGESGVVVLAFGRQIDGGGTRGFDPGELRTYAQIAEAVSGYRDGLQECGAGPVVLAVTTSNYELYNQLEASRLGAEWLGLVESIEDSALVRIEGGTDLEPGWGGLPAARAWASAYRSSGRVLYSNASADGCPYTGPGGGCANGWDTASLAEIVWTGGGVAVPQIYRRDGVQARQWKVLAAAWSRAGGVPVFGGVMTQHRACKQVQNANCPQLSQPHDVARPQLAELLDGLAEVPVGTDIGWG